MKNSKEMKGTAARLVIAALISQLSVGAVMAVAPDPGPGAIGIPTEPIDLRVLAPRSAVINSATLVTWRTGNPIAPTAEFPTASRLEFQYFAGRTNVAPPTRATVLDRTANDQGDLWSNNAIRLAYQKPNDIGLGILIYTDNEDNGTTDPLFGVTLRGGVVGCGGPTDPGSIVNQAGKLTCSDPTNLYRTSVLPLLWKAVPREELAAVSQANAITGANPVSNTPGTVGSSVYMPIELETQTGGPCPNDGPYQNILPRPQNGFCDYSVHYMVDMNNNIIMDAALRNLSAGSWYEFYNGADDASQKRRRDAYAYTSVVGPFGANQTENGAGPGQFNPAYLLLGLKATNAVRTQYATTIWLEARNL
jgi:hypothetical protein